MSKTLSDRAFIDTVPASIAGDGQIKGLAAGVMEALADVTSLVPSLLILPRIDDLPEPVLDLLGWQLHVDYWESGLPLDQKRNLVKKSIILHRHKGTPGIIEQILEDVLGLSAEIREWYQYDDVAEYLFGMGEPYHFLVYVDADEFRALTVDELGPLFDIVLHYKNARSWLDGLFHAGRSEADIVSAGGGVAVGRDWGLVINHIKHEARGELQSAGGGVGATRDRAENEGEFVVTAPVDIAVGAGGVSTAIDYSRAQYSL